MPKKKTVKNKCDSAWGKSIHKKELCERCKRRNLLLNAHHVKCRNRYPRLRHELRNGCLLCVDCHHWAHADPIQFSEWFKVERKEDWKWLREQTKASGKAITLQDLQETYKNLLSNF